MPPATEQSKKTKKAPQPRYCDCPRCAYRTTPVSYYTWKRHQQDWAKATSSANQEPQMLQAGPSDSQAPTSHALDGSVGVSDPSSAATEDENLGISGSVTQSGEESNLPVHNDHSEHGRSASAAGSAQPDPESESFEQEGIGFRSSEPAEPGPSHGLSLRALGPTSTPSISNASVQNLSRLSEQAESSGETEANLVDGPPTQVTDFVDDAEPKTRINITREDRQITDSYIAALENASLDKSAMSEGDISRLRNPSLHSTDLDNDLSLKYSLKLYLDTLGSSDKTYSDIIATLREMKQEFGSGPEYLSHYQVRRRANELAGVAAVEHDMCPQGCMAYTGPLEKRETCPTCSTSRWNTQKLQLTGKKFAAQKFTTITLGSQLQALYSTPEIAKHMHYRHDKTHDIRNQFPSPNPTHPPSPTSFEDYVHGSDYLASVHDGEIQDNDILLMLSLDGAQLYEHRASDCWMWVWVILELGPDRRYKKSHVLPGGFIPGPNKPKHIDSFLFPSLYHIAALQNEGLKIWDASLQKEYLARPLVYLATADAPGMVYLSGLVGHSGARGCCNYCGILWRHKPTSSHYYPILHLPNNYSSNQSQSFPDIDLRSGQPSPFFDQTIYNQNLIRILQSWNDFETVRKETGISKASLFSGLVTPLGVPGAFPLDTMHLLALNIPDLLVSLWRGSDSLRPDTRAGDNPDTWDWAVLKDTRHQKTWSEHGARVAELSKYLPSSYD